MSRILYDGTLFADYFQFFLCDENNSQLPEDYSEESIRQRLIMAPHAAIVHAARNADVDVLVEGTMRGRHRSLQHSITSWKPASSRIPAG